MSTDSRKLDGKVALVMGGSRGIGAAIARRLAADGAAVALTYRRKAWHKDVATCGIWAGCLVARCEVSCCWLLANSLTCLKNESIECSNAFLVR